MMESSYRDLYPRIHQDLTKNSPEMRTLQREAVWTQILQYGGSPDGIIISKLMCETNSSSYCGLFFFSSLSLWVVYPSEKHLSLVKCVEHSILLFKPQDSTVWIYRLADLLSTCMCIFWLCSVTLVTLSSVSFDHLNPCSCVPWRLPS